MKKRLLIAVLWLIIFPASAQHTNQYCNSVYNFCLQLPGNLNHLAESKSGFGEFFTGKDGSSLEVYGTYNAQNEALDQRFNQELAAITKDSLSGDPLQIPVLLKAKKNATDFTLIYQQGSFNWYLYRLFKNNSWICLDYKYPVLNAPEYEAKMEQMIRSLRH